MSDALLPYSQYTRAEMEARIAAGDSFVYYGRIISAIAELNTVDDSVFAKPTGGTDPYPAVSTDVDATARAAAAQAKSDAAAAQAVADAAAATAQAAQRATTAPIPTAVYTRAYSLLQDDQRTIHVSGNGDTVTPPTAVSAKNRRLVFDNAGPGLVTLSGTFISPRADGGWMWTNPTLPAGGALEVVSQFVPGLGSDPAPDDLRVDGVAAPGGTTGAWVWSVVGRNFGGPTAAQFQALSDAVAGKQPAGSYAPLVSGLVPAANLPAYPSVSVQSVAGRIGAVTLAVADIAILQSSLDAKAPLASPTFTGAPAVPTASAGTSTTQAASTAFVGAAVAAAVPAKSFAQPVTTRAIQTVAAAANGWQVSATRDALVTYAVAVSTSVNVISLTANEGYVALELCPTNSATAASWQEVGRVTNGQTVALAVALAMTQKVGGTLTAAVPAGWYCRLRSVSTSGTPAFAVTGGQETVL